jgi:dTDP-4-amino-4,6-dideoxygalactose transaminase
MSQRVYLSPPHLTGRERELVDEAFDSNWIAPLGPQVDAFEQEFSARHGNLPSLATSSGTAALHLALITAGVERGDEVFVSSLTFAGSVFPICYLGAIPVFVDSEEHSWNIDPRLVEEALAARARKGTLPKALIAVHLYGQSADMDALSQLCDAHGIALIEDAAEALGGDYKGTPFGANAHSAIFSFNGNKVVTTSGGGMLVSRDPGVISHARKLATQAREPVVHYEHTEIGYNYRMSNVLAAIGRAQLEDLDNRVDARRRIFQRYQSNLSRAPGCDFMPEASWGRHTRWLTCLTIDPQRFGADREDIRLALERENVESRPLWKPMHLQPVFAERESVGGAVSQRLFERGLCLPSGSNLSLKDVDRISDIVLSCASGARARRIG